MAFGTPFPQPLSATAPPRHFVVRLEGGGGEGGLGLDESFLVVANLLVDPTFDMRR